MFECECVFLRQVSATRNPKKEKIEVLYQLLRFVWRLSEIANKFIVSLIQVKMFITAAYIWSSIS